MEWRLPPYCQVFRAAPGRADSRGFTRCRDPSEVAIPRPSISGAPELGMAVYHMHTDRFFEPLFHIQYPIYYRCPDPYQSNYRTRRSMATQMFRSGPQANLPAIREGKVDRIAPRVLQRIGATATLVVSPYAPLVEEPLFPNLHPSLDRGSHPSHPTIHRLLPNVCVHRSSQSHQPRGIDLQTFRHTIPSVKENWSNRLMISSVLYNYAGMFFGNLSREWDTRGFGRLRT